MPFGTPSDGASAGRIIPNQLNTGGSVPANSTFLYNDGKVNRMIIGQRPLSNNLGVYISKPGIDVQSAQDSQLVVNSDQNMFKIVSKGTASLTGSASISSGTTQTVTVAHNLGFTPASLVYSNAAAVITLQGGSGITTLPIMYVFPGATQSNMFFFIQSRVDSSNIYFDFVCTSGTNNNYSAYTWSFIYYLLQETAN